MASSTRFSFFPCSLQLPYDSHFRLDRLSDRSYHGRQREAPISMSYQYAKVPAQGQKITVQNGKLRVPDHPIIPFVEGDGTGPDITRAMRFVVDKAVEKAYKGQRQ